MKNPIKKLCILLAMVMSFVVVQSVWAGQAGHECNGEVTGTISEFLDNGVIVVEGETIGETIIYGVPDSLGLTGTEVIKVTYFTTDCPEPRNVACSVEFSTTAITTTTIYLR